MRTQITHFIRIFRRISHYLEELCVLQLCLELPPHLGLPLVGRGEGGRQHPGEQLQGHGKEELHEGHQDEHGERDQAEQVGHCADQLSEKEGKMLKLNAETDTSIKPSKLLSEERIVKISL